jgi:thioredoxin reductase
MSIRSEGMPGKRIAIIGAGPIGLEAALYARMQGFDVAVFEKGTVAANVRSWGHVRLFSPFGINSSEWGREALSQTSLPADDALLTGAEFSEQYLLPLSQHLLLQDCIRENTRVVTIGKRRFGKGDAIGNRLRLKAPFTLLIESATNDEELLEADFVLDCSGTFGNHNWLGEGGIPAIGERQLAERIDYHLPDIAGRDRARFSGSRTLVVGSGYSAATAIVTLGELAKQESGTEIFWLTRHANETPLPSIDGDTLQGRVGLTLRANELATGADSRVTWISASTVQQVALDDDRNFKVTIEKNAEQGGSSCKVLSVQNVIANVGYHPDRSLYEELQIHECYASQGPMKLAAALMGQTSADCMTQSTPGADTLKNPEPGFFILGAKSYGRDSRFLLRIGLEQIQSVFDLIAAEAA